MIASLKNALTAISYLSEEEFSLIANIATIKELNAGEFWFYEGMHTKEVAFIYKGYLRTYILKDGKEKTDSFYFENSFPGDMPPIFESSPSKSYCVAMESTVLLTISYKTLNHLATESYNIEHMLRIFTEQAFIRYYYKATSFILQTPKERYESIISSTPMILYRANQYHIASYLGITPQHLSRLRATKA